MGEFVVTGVAGLPEIEPGADLAAMIAERVELADGDIIAITSKIVSKAEGRARTGVERDTVIDDETARVVAEWTTPRGRTRIAQTHHGFVLAAAGVDESNVAPGTVVPLPVDPDGSARRIRAAVQSRTNASVGVLITDTAGRPWRDGQIDFAIGAAGLVVRDDLRGRHDSYGNELGVTVVAVADELAAATELVRHKLDGMPVAVVRGLGHLVTDDDGPGAAALVRPAEEDRFRLGTPEAMRAAVLNRRDVTAFTDEPVDRRTIHDAVAAALTAATPAGATPWRFALVESAEMRSSLYRLLHDTSLDYLTAGGVRESTLAGRTAHIRALEKAPCLIVPCMVADGAYHYSVQRHADAEFRSYLVSAGAGIQNLLVSLAASGIGSFWSPAPLHCMNEVSDLIGLPADWDPVGIIAAGAPAAPGPEHQRRDLEPYLLVR